jgi:hypothetical protein
MELGTSDDPDLYTIEKLIRYDSQMFQTPHSTHAVLPLFLFFSREICAVNI